MRTKNELKKLVNDYIAKNDDVNYETVSIHGQDEVVVSSNSYKSLERFHVAIDNPYHPLHREHDISLKMLTMRDGEHRYKLAGDALDPVDGDDATWAHEDATTYRIVALVDYSLCDDDDDE